MNSIFLGLSTGSTTRDLDISQTCLATVPPEMLAAGVTFLRRKAGSHLLSR